MRKLALLTTALFLLVTAQASAQQLVPFGGPYSAPYYVAGEPGDPSRVYVVEAAGRIRLNINGVTQAGNFLDINGEVFDGGEGGCECGMFSMAFAPDYASSGRFYVFFTRDTAAQHDLVIKEFRRTMDPDNIDEATGRDVLVINHPVGPDNHNGGQLQFGPDGLLYISTGEGGVSSNAQSTSNLLGKLLRINPVGTNPGEYTSPSSNPFVGVTGADEIYSYGLRNPYRFSFDRLTGDLTIGDVGGGAREEIDFTPNGGGLGANFGWPCFEGNQQQSTTGICTPPLANYTPPALDYTRAGSTAAVNGGYVVRDTTLPTLLGRYLYADTFDALNDQIFSAQLFGGGSSGNGPTGMTASFVVSFGEDACAHVYVAHGNTASRIQASTAALACAPQLSLPSAPIATVPPDGRGPALTVAFRKAKRAAARGEVAVIVGCDEACTVRGGGEVVVPGKNLGLGADTLVLAAGASGVLHLDLSRNEVRRLLGVLRNGKKAKAAVDLSATDALGNRSAQSRRIKQKP